VSNYKQAALEIMRKNDIRRLVVMDKRPIGLITQKQVCGNLKNNNLLLPELEISDKTFCPYCSTKFKDNKSLCSHIDRIHITHKDKNVIYRKLRYSFNTLNHLEILNDC
jgi:signal-transduction protein with cAMP-binding, CBS, and nucleotidyltransferase domain